MESEEWRVESEEWRVMGGRRRVLAAGNGLMTQLYFFKDRV